MSRFKVGAQESGVWTNLSDDTLGTFPDRMGVEGAESLVCLELSVFR